MLFHYTSETFSIVQENRHFLFSESYETNSHVYPVRRKVQNLRILHQAAHLVIPSVYVKHMSCSEFLSLLGC